jgi:hypothetical protein
MLNIKLVVDVIEVNFTPILSLLVFFVVLLCWGNVGHQWKCSHYGARLLGYPGWTSLGVRTKMLRLVCLFAKKKKKELRRQ